VVTAHPGEPPVCRPESPLRERRAIAIGSFVLRVASALWTTARWLSKCSPRVRRCDTGGSRSCQVCAGCSVRGVFAKQDRATCASCRLRGHGCRRRACCCGGSSAPGRGLDAGPPDHTGSRGSRCDTSVARNDGLCAGLPSPQSGHRTQNRGACLCGLWRHCKLARPLHAHNAHPVGGGGYDIDGESLAAAPRPGCGRFVVADDRASAPLSP
jgi:hypothetical protein